MVPKRYIRKIWIGFNPRKEVVMASETATREMIRAETLKTLVENVKGNNILAKKIEE